MTTIPRAAFAGILFKVGYDVFEQLGQPGQHINSRRDDDIRRLSEKDPCRRVGIDDALPLVQNQHPVVHMLDQQIACDRSESSSFKRNSAQAQISPVALKAKGVRSKCRNGLSPQI